MSSQSSAKEEAGKREARLVEQYGAEGAAAMMQVWGDEWVVDQVCGMYTHTYVHTCLKTCRGRQKQHSRCICIDVKDSINA
jgi:hypothetical protein